MGSSEVLNSDIMVGQSYIFVIMTANEDNQDDQELDEGQNLYEHHNIEVDPKQSAIRIDKFLMARLPHVSRNKIQEAIKNEFVLVNQNPIKPNYKVRPADLIKIFLPNPPHDTDVVPEDIPINIVHEDDDLLVVNKAAGMVVHPAYNNWTGTLVNALTYHFKNLPEMPDNEGRPGLVHRIDKDTSGLLVIAKSERALNSLAKQFFDHSIDRTYLALVWSEPPEEGRIEVNLGRSLKDRRVTAAFPKGDFGRRAVTNYKVVERLRYVTLVECKLETGRTHQIRAHMKYLGHPIFNDATYGGDQILKGTKFSKYKSFVQNCFNLIPRQALHAKSLGFVHPATGKKIFFDSNPPIDFEMVLEKWRHYVKHTD